MVPLLQKLDTGRPKFPAKVVRVQSRLPIPDQNWTSMKDLAVAAKSFFFGCVPGCNCRAFRCVVWFASPPPPLVVQSRPFRGLGRWPCMATLPLRFCFSLHFLVSPHGVSWQMPSCMPMGPAHTPPRSAPRLPFRQASPWTDTHVSPCLLLPSLVAWRLVVLARGIRPVRGRSRAAFSFGECNGFT